jgi:hypothetical protein
MGIDYTLLGVPGNKVPEKAVKPVFQGKSAIKVYAEPFHFQVGGFPDEEDYEQQFKKTRQTCFPTEEPEKGYRDKTKKKIRSKGKGKNVKKTVQCMKCSDTPDTPYNLKRGRIC